jgi:hypothetical protein
MIKNNLDFLIEAAKNKNLKLVQPQPEEGGYEFQDCEPTKGDEPSDDATASNTLLGLLSMTIKDEDEFNVANEVLLKEASK